MVARSPNFFVLGAAKSGTTALYDYLRQHPDIYMSPRKETNFFALMGRRPDYRGPGDAETINALSISMKADYLAQFADVTAERAVGEASPLYLYDPAVPARIRHCLPHAKLVVILRQPADRAFSAFLHTRRDGREPVDDFERALALEDARVAAGWEHLWHYWRMGLYGAQVRRYRQLFPADQLHVVLYDEFCANPEGVLASIFRFLGVEYRFFPATNVEARPNASVQGRALLPADMRGRLTRRYLADLSVLERLLDRPLTNWRAA